MLFIALITEFALKFVSKNICVLLIRLGTLKSFSYVLIKILLEFSTL